MLGITGQYIDATTARFYGLTQGYSIVKLNSNVSDAGLQKSDIITKIDGNNVSSETTVQNVIAKEKPGDTVELEVYRPTTGESFTATVTLTEYSPYELAYDKLFHISSFPNRAVFLLCSLYKQSKRGMP